MRQPILIGALFVTLAGLTAQAAEPPAARNGARFTKFILGVADLDRAYAFYQALGFSLSSGGELRKPAPLNDTIRSLVDVPAGTHFRNMMLKVPGADFQLEVTEFSNLDLHPGKPRSYDPGAARLILVVRDIDAALVAARKAGGEVVTAGGAPLGVGPNNGNGAVLVRDPDSYYVEFLQPAKLPSTTAPAGSNVIGARFGTVVADAEKAALFYRDHFGLEAKVNAWTSDDNVLKLSGLSGGQFRAATVTVPGTTLTWSFFQFKAGEATPYKLRIPDPGAPAVGFQVRDLGAASAAMKSMGGSVITTGEGHLSMPNGGMVAFTRDPNGVLVELAQESAK